MNKIKNLLKGSPVLMVVIGVLVAGIASAAILAVYTTMTGTSNVKQSVVFAGWNTEHEYIIGDSDAIAGNIYIDGDILYNTSETTAPIKFITQYKRTGYTGWESSEPGIETSYWSTVELSSKNSDWNVTEEMKGNLTYKLVSPKFEYEFEATGLQDSTPYSLIYYADEPERFENWGGANPGVLIAEFTTDEDGNIYAEGTESQPVKGSKNLNINLPTSPDWNATAEANYCNNTKGDNYNLCRGAKIWLVPSSSYDKTEKALTDWDPTTYLFETDLITYSDSDKDGEALYLGEGNLNFFVKNILDIALVPGEYKIKTEVMPVL